MAQATNVHTTVDDEAFQELIQLVGQRVVHFQIWEDRLADSLAEELKDSVALEASALEFDIDLYLEDGVYFELFSVLLFPDPELEPLNNRTEIALRFQQLQQASSCLDEVAVDDEDALVLILGAEEPSASFLVAGAWTLDEWKELPDDADST